MPSKVELAISVDYHCALSRGSTCCLLSFRSLLKSLSSQGAKPTRVLFMAALMDTYARLPVAFSHGNGAYLYDEQGNKYLDALAGLAVTGLGHAHPGVAAAITRQANSLMHTSNLYRISLQESLADRITALAGMDRVFFCNSGAEANAAALKLARL